MDREKLNYQFRGLISYRRPALPAIAHYGEKCKEYGAITITVPQPIAGMHLLILTKAAADATMQIPKKNLSKCNFPSNMSFLSIERQNAKAVIAIEDKRILLMLNNRDEQALTATAAKYGALCRSVALDILGNEQDAEECINDALLAIWNAIPPAQPENYRAYLLKILRNIALDRYKAKQRDKRGSGQYADALDELAEILPGTQNTEDTVEQREMLEAVSRFLETLPKTQSDLFVRRYWRFSSFEDLAHDYGMTVNHVRVTLTRLRKRLQKYLRKEGLL